MRAHIAIASALVLALAGCGDDSAGSGAASPLDEALGYLAEDAPLVIAIETDVDGSQFKALEAIADKFPLGGSLRDQLLNELNLGSDDFDNEVKPILGNEFVVGATDVLSIVDESEDDDFVAAIQAKDGGALEDAVEKEGAEQSGDKSGATLYEDDDGDTFAIKDDVLVVAGSKELLDAALEQREADDRLTEEVFERGLEDLADEGLIRAYGDVGALLENDPEAADARKVAWVGALDTFGLTASVEEDQVAIDFNLATDGDLEAGELPLAPGGESPGVVRGEGEVGVGIRDLNHIFQFGQTAGQAVDPSGFGDFETAKKQISDQLGVSIDDDVFGQLEGDVSISFDPDGNLGARADLKDPAAFRKTLEKAAPEISSLIGSAAEYPGASPRLKKPSGGDGLYELVQPGDQSYFFGVDGDVLVVSNKRARAAELASAEPEAVEGAGGAVVFTMNTEELADRFLAQRGGIEAIGGQLFTGPLGDLTGSVESSADGLRGSITLGFD